MAVKWCHGKLITKSGKPQHLCNLSSRPTETIDFLKMVAVEVYIQLVYKHHPSFCGSLDDVFSNADKELSRVIKVSRRCRTFLINTVLVRSSSIKSIRVKYTISELIYTEDIAMKISRK